MEVFHVVIFFKKMTWKKFKTNTFSIYLKQNFHCYATGLNRKVVKSAGATWEILLEFAFIFSIF